MYVVPRKVPLKPPLNHMCNIAMRRTVVVPVSWSLPEVRDRASSDMLLSRRRDPPENHVGLDEHRPMDWRIMRVSHRTSWTSLKKDLGHGHAKTLIST